MVQTTRSGVLRGRAIGILLKGAGSARTVVGGEDVTANLTAAVTTHGHSGWVGGGTPPIVLYPYAAGLCAGCAVRSWPASPGSGHTDLCGSASDWLFRSLALVPVNLDVVRRAAGRDDVGQLVAVEVADDQILGRHSAVVHHRLRLQGSVAIDSVNRQARFGRAAPADCQFVAAIAVEVRPPQRMPFCERGFDRRLRPGPGFLSVDGDAGAVPGFDRGEHPAAADASECHFTRRALAKQRPRPSVGASLQNVQSFLARRDELL